MIYVISKSTCGSYDVRDIQCNANWDCCPYSDYALIPDNLVDGILATQGYCDITLSDDGTAVTGFTARAIPDVPKECCGINAVLSVNGVTADSNGAITLTPEDIGASGGGSTVTAIDFTNFENGSFTETVDGAEVSHSVTFDSEGRPATIDGVTITWGDV